MRRCRQKQQQQQNTVFPITLHTLPTMRDKSVETLSFQRVFWCMLFNYYHLAQKTTPLLPNNVGFPHCTNDGLCSSCSVIVRVSVVLKRTVGDSD